VPTSLLTSRQLPRSLLESGRARGGGWLTDKRDLVNGTLETFRAHEGARRDRANAHRTNRHRRAVRRYLQAESSVVSRWGEWVAGLVPCLRV